MKGAALLLALGAATPTDPSYEVGDAFVYSDGRVERVRRIEDGTVTWAGLAGSTYQRSVNPVVPVLSWRVAGVRGQRHVAGAADSLWPLHPGRSARFRVVTEISRDEKSRRSVAFWTCRTGKTGEITVPAGTFESVPVECDRYSPWSMRLVERVQWDWSPEIGHYVRRRTTHFFDAHSTEIALVAALPSDAASLPRLRALSEAAKSGTLPPSD